MCEHCKVNPYTRWAGWRTAYLIALSRSSMTGERHRVVSVRVLLRNNRPWRVWRVTPA